MYPFLCAKHCCARVCVCVCWKRDLTMVPYVYSSGSPIARCIIDCQIFFFYYMGFTYKFCKRLCIMRILLANILGNHAHSIHVSYGNPDILIINEFISKPRTQNTNFKIKHNRFSNPSVHLVNREKYILHYSHFFFVKVVSNNKNGTNEEM